MVNTSKKRIFIAVISFIVVAIIVAVGVVWWNYRAGRVTLPPPTPPITTPPPPTPTPPPATAPLSPIPSPTPPPEAPLAVAVAQNLEIPWSLAFLADGSLIFTERAGRIRLYDAREGLVLRPLLTIPEVAHQGEGGLLGVAVHPNFSSNRFIYVYYTYQRSGGLANRVVRFRMEGRNLVDKTIIIDNIPGASIHDGGRIKFGPDGMLYITAGDSANADLAQSRDSLAGKILRLKDDGTIPSDNPFPNSPVYSYGHRNPQGLTWDDRGRLWETEHGSSATDELNLIEPGKNYGWPVIRGNETAPGMQSPIIQSGSDTWAPSGLAFYDGALYFTGLRGQSLFQVIIDGQNVTLKRHLDRNFGRLRDVVVGPDNLLYILTNNRDGRGVPTADDDQIIRINPRKLP